MQYKPAADVVTQWAAGEASQPELRKDPLPRRVFFLCNRNLKFGHF